MNGWKVHKYMTPRNRQSVWFVGDIHTGSCDTDEDSLFGCVRRIKNDRNASVILMGDLIEMALRPDMRMGQFISPNEQVDLLAEYLSPIRNKVSFVLSGNHEQRTERVAEVDFTKNAIMPLFPKAEYLGYEGFISYQVNGHPPYLIYVNHGNGKSTSTYYLLDRAVEKVGMDVADIVAIAHGHKRDVKTYTRWVFDWDTDTVIPRKVYGIRTGSFLNYAQYARNELLPAAEVGAVNVHLGERIQVNWD